MKNLSWVITFGLIGLNLAIWQSIVFSGQSANAKFSFLDVGQGDATLVEFGTGVQILTDAGPSKRAARELEKVLDETDRYIDLALITHPQLDHFAGLSEILDRYEIGALIINGREMELAEWKELIGKIKSKKIPIIVLAAGDRIKNAENKVDILSPDSNFIQSGEINDTSIVALVQTEKLKLILTGDIGENVEKYLVQKLGRKLKADILKVPHHGSKYSSSDEFLKTVGAKLAVIEVGDNRYGHPTRETLARLFGANVLKIFRTDENRTISAKIEGEKLIFLTIP